ncbi:uncharacterized protein N0V89_004559 [Didymosphaeria variabile]|uniref:P-loop containing nucleoside triphosphate hydrolase protein n=1 Tax=Didymosphaeria variabile TaxID=1932322 RepID=A0A9W8XSP3_9PLEO|nr:uncharacterized protein N0V89_004559 [Didymosphaeria variabile]KAJ4356525.1 hypothetical protein N0V89_004559 [Didymosphaeria variabile]
MSTVHLNITILGESGVGKTSFADKVSHDTQYWRYAPTISPAFAHMSLQVDGDLYDLNFQDISLTPIRVREPGFADAIINSALRSSRGVVLLYDITSEESYRHVTEFGWTYLWGCRDPGGQSRIGDYEEEYHRFPSETRKFGCVLVGNKVDLVQGDNSEKREVPKELAEEWASMVGVEAFEVDRYDKGVLEDVLRALIRNTNWARRRNEEDSEEDNEVVRDRQKTKEETAQEPEKRKSTSGRFPAFTKLKDILKMTRRRPEREE